MSRYADPLRCPECRAHLVPASPDCPSCGLPLQGEVAGRLYATLLHADELLGTLRAQQLAAGARGPAPFTAGRRTGGAVTGDLPRFPTTPRSQKASAPAIPLPDYLARQLGGRPRPGLSALSVPRILLGLGATCLLVAALVFLAVTWSALGVGGRTAVLVGLTAVAGGLAGGLARRGLRAAAESLALVAYGLLALDLVGAAHAGWFGYLSGPGLARLAGGVLVVTGVAGALAARRWSAGTLVGAEVACVVGAALAATGVCTDERLSLSVALVLGVLLAAAVTGLGHAVGLRFATAGSAAVTVATWTALAGHGLLLGLEAGDAGGGGWHRLWLDGAVWPLLAAAAFAAVPAALPRVVPEGRVAAVAVTVALLTAAGLTPAFGQSPTVVALVALAVLAGSGPVGWLLPRPWGLVVVLDQLAAAAVLLTVTGEPATRSAQRVVTAVGGLWSGRAVDVLPRAVPGLPGGWLLPVAAVALIGTALALAAASDAVERGLAPVRDVRWAAVVLVASAAAGAALFAVPLWTLPAAGLATAAGFTLAWLRRPRVGTLLVVAVSIAVAALVALHAEALTAGAAAGAVACAAVVQLRGRDSRHAAGAGAVLAVSLAALVWTCGWWWGVEPALAATAGGVAMVALALLPPYSPRRWWAADRPLLARAGSEAAAAGAGTVLAAAGIVLAPVGEQASWAAVLLTVGGAGVTAMSMLRSDRSWLRPAGGLLLVAATWVRLWDLGVTAPEAYTLPSAAVLLAIGLHRLRRRDVGTSEALSAGLFLALTPSLLWVLQEPNGPRAAVLGLACLLLVLAGARLGWTAPLVAGALVGALLVVRLAAPYVDEAVPRWLLIGAAGALLVVVGATWERRLIEATALLGYVRRLR